MKNKLRVGVLVSGNGSNLQALIDACKDPNYPAEIVVVGSNKFNAYGLIRAQMEGIDSFFLDPISLSEKYDDELSKTIESYNVDLICLAGYLKLLKAPFVNKWKNKILNIHPSLLPKFKGLHAQQQAFDSKDTITGCTVHYVTEELDAGPIIGQQPVDILPWETVEELSERILIQEHILYAQCLKIVALEKLSAKL